MVKAKPINVSNTTLSTYKGNRHRKFDTKQAKRHDFGKAHCAVCDKVFTKNHWNTKSCSEECKRERKIAHNRKYREDNREKANAIGREYYKENREKIKAKARKSYEKNRKDPEWVEKERARKRKYYEKNRKDPEWVEKLNASGRKYREKNREKVNAKNRKYYE